MGQKKTKKAENCKKVVDASILEASLKIETLAAKQGIKVIDHYAVEKELVKAGSISSEKHFTRWGEIEYGQRTLLVLSNLGDKVKSYPDYATRFSSIRTIKH